MTPTVARGIASSRWLHDVASDLVAHDVGIDVVEGGESRPADQEVRRVDQRPSEVADADHDHVVEAVVAERLGDALDEDRRRRSPRRGCQRSRAPPGRGAPSSR